MLMLQRYCINNIFFEVVQFFIWAKLCVYLPSVACCTANICMDTIVCIVRANLLHPVGIVWHDLYYVCKIVGL